MDVSTIRERIEHILDHMTDEELKDVYQYAKFVHIYG